MKYAEKAIPDDSPEVGLTRLNAACLFVLQMMDKEKVDEKELEKALTQIHAEVEEAGGLKKPKE